jgi:EAL domain-containing protein (putative c-di-GMP-specific phosphodiesterase class I)
VLVDDADSEALARSAAALLSVFDEPFELGGLRLNVGASVGGALHTQGSSDPTALLREADVAMYEAKREGGGFMPYSASGDADPRERLTLAQELHDAIPAGELTLFYQPQLELPGGRLGCFEALVRWRHPRHGLLAPDSFLPIAEEAGLMRPLTAWVLREALAQLGRWESATGRRASVAVNLATANLLDTGLPDAVEDALAAARIEPERLVLEVSEKLLMNDIDRITGVLTRLHHLGVVLSLDDFGAGYTSFAHLRRLPLDEVKIDRSFVMRMTDDAQDAAIVAAALQLARNLGLRTVAEGVESAEVWSKLERLGANALQGFHISRPVPADELTGWMSDRGWLALGEPPVELPVT